MSSFDQNISIADFQHKPRPVTNGAEAGCVSAAIESLLQMPESVFMSAIEKKHNKANQQQKGIVWLIAQKLTEQTRHASSFS
jgi:hypothetical protein